MDRAKRLHWVLAHIEEKTGARIELFSIIERDKTKRKDIIRTYIYNLNKKYVLVLEPQRSKTDYYLLTAFYLNKDFGTKMMRKKLKKKLDVVH